MATEPLATDESTPLMEAHSPGGHGPSSYYFLSRKDPGSKEGSSDALGGVAGAAGGEEMNAAATQRGEEGTGSPRKEEVIEILPEGATSEEFRSRPLSSPRRTNGPPSPRSSRRIAVAAGASSDAAVLKHRQAAIKVEPKVFFANERTFLAWLHTSVLLAGASIAITSFARANPLSQLYGIILLPISIAFISYAMIQYARRASMIRRRAPGPYEDIMGPTVLGIILMLSIVAQFSIKLYSVL
eukprot:CAMPEP_0183298054 /NCGR_PEP_ID=MMETSP0160_2-20130417/5186_1 /TAXON_ID=2839 ORGANISM="Odontella Sinensis, Strain Grunow 1884" /NCGR_SAMPLE_ID=MMETSP0160_2 /ASSEMBLY_ACC=CAM_ASM_000250 /LENGTH=241 /DNA_ID=CAMNT_0025459999 /DNA_START=36 /DNA_END=761 /DNA_ORIENTATION=-